MPVYGVVDNFNETVTTDAAQVTPGNTQNVVLSGVTGLPTDGKAILSVFRLRQGREPQPIETLRDWSGISGTTLTGAVRVTGAALLDGDVVTIGFNSLLWASLATGGSFASPTFTGTVTADNATFALDGATLGTSGDEFDIVGTVDFSGATVVGLSAGFDIIVTTAAELVAAMVSGNAGKRIWVKSGTYSLTSAHLVIQNGMHITWGGGATGSVTLDFGDTAYYLRSHDDARWGFHDSMSGGTVTITGGSLDYDPDSSGSSAALPNAAGWRCAIDGQVGTYAYASASTFTISPAPLIVPPNGAGTAYPFLLTKNAAEDVVMSGRLIVKGSSGTGAGTTTPCYFLVGYGWNLSALTLEAVTRGVKPTNQLSHCLTHLCNSIIGKRITRSEATFSRPAGANLTTMVYLISGQNCVYQDESDIDVNLLNNETGTLSLRHLWFKWCSHITVASYQSQRASIDGSGTNAHLGIGTSTNNMCVLVLSGSGTGWKKNGTQYTTASNASDLTGSFSANYGSRIGAGWLFTP